MCIEWSNFVTTRKLVRWAFKALRSQLPFPFLSLLDAKAACFCHAQALAPLGECRRQRRSWSSRPNPRLYTHCGRWRSWVPLVFLRKSSKKKQGGVTAPPLSPTSLRCEKGGICDPSFVRAKHREVWDPATSKHRMGGFESKSLWLKTHPPVQSPFFFDILKISQFFLGKCLRSHAMGWLKWLRSSPYHFIFILFLRRSGKNFDKQRNFDFGVDFSAHPFASEPRGQPAAKRDVDVGHVCSVCFSVFCTPLDQCPTCGVAYRTVKSEPTDAWPDAFCLGCCACPVDVLLWRRFGVVSIYWITDMNYLIFIWNRFIYSIFVLICFGLILICGFNGSNAAFDRFAFRPWINSASWNGIALFTHIFFQNLIFIWDDPMSIEAKAFSECGHMVNRVH